MSRIRSRNTGIERKLRSELWARGIRYRLHYVTPAGRADIAFPRQKVAVFVDGCFWHGCPEHYVSPRSRADFWSAKLRDNVERDQRQTKILEQLGWISLRLWEHEVHASLKEVVSRVSAALQGSQTSRSNWRVFRVKPANEDGTLERRTLVELRGSSSPRVEQHVRHTRKW